MNDRLQENGTVLGIAAVASGVVGTIAAALMDRESEPESPERSERRLRKHDAKAHQETSNKKRTFLKKKAPEPAPSGVDQARQRASELGSQLTTLAAGSIETARSRIESGDLQHASQRLSTALKEISREGASRAEGLGTDVAARASSLVSDAKNQVPALKGRAGKVAVDAKGRGTQLGEQVRERLPEVRDRVESRVVPLVKEVRSQAKPILGDVTAAATRALSAAEAKAQGARTWVEQDALPETRLAVADVSQKAVEKAKNAEHVLGSVSSGATGKLSGVGESIEERSRQAANVAAKGTRDTGSLVFWSSVAGGLVFYAFLTEEQRERVKAAGRRIGSEAREIYRDIQGYDEEFS